MSSSIEVIEREVLNLPLPDRARLANMLIASLEVDPDVEEAWAAEIERRAAEVENGSVSLLPGDEVMTRLKAQFR